MAQHILVTGATGFVGRAIAEQLIGFGYGVLATCRDRRPTIPGIEWLPLQGDARPILTDALRQYDVGAIIHTAGRTNGVPADIIAANEGFTAELMAAVSATGVRPAIYYLSTVSAIGPTGLYGQTKRRAEALVAEQAPARWAVLRSSLIHGPHDTKNVAMLIRAVRYWPAVPVVGGSAVKLQPLYVRDLAGAFMALLAGQGASGGIYIASGPRQERLTDMIRAIQDRIGRHAPLVPVPIGPVRWAITAADRLLPFLNLPAQQVRALHDHPMYRSDEAARDLGFHPRLFADALTDYL